MFMYVFNIAGSVESRQCAVQIGFGHGYNNFRGRLSLVGINCTLKSFKIYIFLQNVLDNLILIVFKINNMLGYCLCGLKLQLQNTALFINALN